MTRSMHDIDWMVIKQNKVLHVITALQFELPQLLVTQTKNGLWYNSSVLKHNYLATIPQPGKEMMSSSLTEGWTSLAGECNCIHVMSPAWHVFWEITCVIDHWRIQIPKNSQWKICLISTHLCKQTVFVIFQLWLLNPFHIIKRVIVWFILACSSNVSKNDINDFKINSKNF